MIAQNIFDWLSGYFAQLFALMPPLPVEFTQAVTAISTGLVQVGDVVEPLGAIIPWVTIQTLVTWYLGVLTFWAAMAVVRLVLFAIGR